MILSLQLFPDLLLLYFSFYFFSYPTRPVCAAHIFMDMWLPLETGSTSGNSPSLRSYQLPTATKFGVGLPAHFLSAHRDLIWLEVAWGLCMLS